MNPLRIKGETRRLAEEQGEYTALSIRDDVISGVPIMYSLWEPTPRELNELLLGGSVRLAIAGKVHPPIHLSTQPAPKLTDT